MKLFEHRKVRRKPKNTNQVHKDEQQGLNATIAVWLTSHIGTMWAAYLLACICMIGLVAIFGFIPAIFVAIILWFTSEFLSLILLPIIMVGQNLLGRKSELQADEAYKTTMESYTDIEEVMQHLSKQDDELLKQTEILIALAKNKGG